MIEYDSLVNRTVRRIKPSGIRKFFDIANEMDDVISLSVGEPDFHTPWHIREAGIESLEKGRTSYTPNRGFLKLRAEISNFIERHYHVKYDPQGEVLVTVGGSEAIDLCVRTLVEPGDEVLIPEPSFVCYVPITEMAGGVPVIIETKPENGFRLTAQELEEENHRQDKAVDSALSQQPHRGCYAPGRLGGDSPGGGAPQPAGALR